MIRGLREYELLRRVRRATALCLRRRTDLRRGLVKTIPALGHGLRRALRRFVLRRFVVAPFRKLRTYAMCDLELRRAMDFFPFFDPIFRRGLIIPKCGFIRNGSFIVNLPFEKFG
jgi:hypothetical protein